MKSNQSLKITVTIDADQIQDIADDNGWNHLQFTTASAKRIFGDACQTILDHGLDNLNAVNGGKYDCTAKDD